MTKLPVSNASDSADATPGMTTTKPSPPDAAPAEEAGALRRRIESLELQLVEAGQHIDYLTQSDHWYDIEGHCTACCAGPSYHAPDCPFAAAVDWWLHLVRQPCVANLAADDDAVRRQAAREEAVDRAAEERSHERHRFSGDDT